MDDRTLLLKAARAYWGTEIDDVVSVEWSDEDQSILYTHADNQDHNGLDRTYRWNSLEEDDDALLLAVKLRMRVQIDDYGAAARIGDKGTWHGFEAHMHGGIEAATRRAITCAAAAMADEGAR